MDPLSGSLIGPEGFLLSAYIIPDHSICRIQHILGRSVILLKPDHCCFRIVFFKIQYIADIGSPEFVDRLIIITNHTQIMSVSGKQPDQLKLGTVGILILIHHNIPKPVLVALQHIRAVLKKLYRFHDQIIKVHCIVLFQRLLVLLVQGGNLLLMIVSHCT